MTDFFISVDTDLSTRVLSSFVSLAVVCDISLSCIVFCSVIQNNSIFVIIYKLCNQVRYTCTYHQCNTSVDYSFKKRIWLPIQNQVPCSGGLVLAWDRLSSPSKYFIISPFQQTLTRTMER